MFLKPAATFIILWDFLMFYEIFYSPQVKGCAFITYKHGIYDLPHELPNDVRPRKLGNTRKVSNFIEWYHSVQSSCQNENFVNPSKTLKNKN